MSLTFGAVNSDRVRCGSAAALDDLSTLSMIAWVYPTTLAAGSRFVTKDNGVGTAGWFWNIRGTAGAFGMAGLFSTTNGSSQSSTGYLTANAWHCIGTSWDRGGGAAPKLYHGTLSTLMAETTYATQTTPVGSYLSDAAVDLTIGNTGAGSPVSSLQGRLGVVALFNRVLTAGEFQAWQFDPRVLSGCLGYWRLGDNGTGTQPDLSGNGNAGTVTGATQSANPPLQRWRRGLVVPMPYRSPVAYTQGVAGLLTPAGALAKATSTAKAGAVTPAGALVKETARLLAGAITPSGALSAVRTFLRTLEGAIAPAGALVKDTARTLTGAIAGVCTLTKETARALAGSLTPSATLAAVKTFLRTLTGAITPSGTLVRDVAKALAGALTPTGALVRAVSRTLTGALTPTGALASARTAFLTLAGALTPSGTLSRLTATTRAGSLTPTGTVSRAISRALAGALGLAGVLTTLLTQVGAFAVRLFNRSGQRYRLTDYSGPRYAITNESGPRYTLTNRSAHDG